MEQPFSEDRSCKYFCGSRRTMWRSVLTLYQLLLVSQPLWARAEGPVEVITPQICSLECIRKERPECEYCRVTSDDIKNTLGFNSLHVFRGCLPWPCLELLGDEDPTTCMHYVEAPNDLKIEFIDEDNLESDTVVVSWKPSQYGIAFLRGFQVFMQRIGSTAVACQLLLFNRNVSHSASQAQKVYKSDPFPNLSLGSRYVVTVMALPVPEQWDKFNRNISFYTRSCAEKKGLEQCKEDWYPQHIEVQQNGSVITVTFNLAPPKLGIRRYFSICYGNKNRNYTDIVPDSSKNKTHHRFQLNGLHKRTNYTCEIAAKEVNAKRNRFWIYVKDSQKDIPAADSPSLAVVLSLCLTVAATFGVLLVALMCWRSKMHAKKLNINSEIISLKEENKTQKEVLMLPGDRPTPPRLLICYSSCDGPAHVNAVMQLAAFIQKHMATQVCLDLWDSLSIAEEGSMAWHCRQIRESDFILVICSPGFRQSHDQADQEFNHDNILDVMSTTCSSKAIIQLIGEEVGQAKARGEDLSKYMAAIFQYCKETDIPIELRLASHYTLPCDFPLLFSHLHGVALHRPGSYLMINNITEEGFTTVPTGAALQVAIQEAGMSLSGEPQQTLEGQKCNRVEV
ncbi:PREDICTED: interleukin-17 receptor D-like [Cyprinodon variegatus]|uniref:Si:ch211-207e14.4 n=1 Tax=Cyprinodon variegatus TaxID=28743 RepID=A0A3Q2EEL8_CYPVA|nr:PREDICTED: interleukin-17 receptor D-like [Cyprinodon variegatus]